MKTITLIFMLLICGSTLNAQDTLDKKIIVKHLSDDYLNEYTNDSLNDYSFISNVYTIRVNSEFASSVYTHKAGRNFIAAGSFLFLGSTFAIIPSLFDNSTIEKADRNVKYTYVCEAIAGACFITTMVCLISGGVNMQKSAITLRSGKNYIIETNGQNIKFKF